jgi:hypothetical protein
VSWAAVLVVNITALAVLWFIIKNGWWKTEEQTVVSPVATPQQLVSEPQQCGDNLICASTCKQLFDAALATLAGQPKNNPVTSAASQNKAGEYFIPLGSVTLKSFDWVDTGMQAYVDPANYQGLKAVYFEASMRIPTANGRVWLRLVQANENSVVPGSEIWGETDKPRMATSAPITLWSGNKLYKVQLKTTMDFEAVVDSARLRIVF